MVDTETTEESSVGSPDVNGHDQEVEGFGRHERHVAQPEAPNREKRNQSQTAGRRRAEQQLQQRMAQLESIYRLTDTVSRAHSIEEIYEQALNGLQRTLDADRASV